MSDDVTKISIFGPLDFRINGNSIHLCISGSTRSLLQYLLCYHDQLCRRDKLMEVFWPDTLPKRRRSSLNSAIWRIKRELKICPCIKLDATAECVRLIGLETGNVNVDYIQLARAVHNSGMPSEFSNNHLNNLIVALNNCNGDPLDGLEDEWAIVERERLSNLHIRGLTIAMHRLAEIQQYEQALEFGQRIMRLAPFRECTLQEMLCLHVLSGQRVKVLQLFNEFENTLQDDLGIEPMVETRALRDYLVGDRHFKANLQTSNVSQIWQTNVSFLLQAIENSRDALRAIC